MPVTLPTKVVAASLFSPKVLLLYGMPKIGKTEILVMLEELMRQYAAERGDQTTLILEGDPRGTEPYNCTWFPLTTYTAFKETIKAIEEMGKQRYNAGLKNDLVYPYRYLMIDPISSIEDIAVASLTTEYLIGAKATSKPTDVQKDALANKETWSVLDIPFGSGVFDVRERVKQMIEILASVCHKLIFIAHVKDKMITDMANNVVNVTEIALTGKLGEIVAARVDAIGFLSRAGDKPMKVSFLTDGKSTMGSRFKYLAGKTMEFSWQTIFPDEFGMEIPKS